MKKTPQKTSGKDSANVLLLTRLDRISEMYALFHCLDPAPTQQCATTANTTKTSCVHIVLGRKWWGEIKRQ